jgi:putative nucleotidyltransferase with HDIG domain
MHPDVWPTTLTRQLETGLVSLGLLAAAVWAGTHPVHIRHQTKVYLTTLPLYLLGVLVPPPLAALVAGIGILLAQLRMRPMTGNLPSDIATAVGRWVLVVAVTGVVAQWPAPGPAAQTLALCAAAALMFLLDVVTCAFELSPMSGEPRLKIMRALLEESTFHEGAQYMVALLGAFAALHQAWTLALMVVPMYIVYRTFKNAKEMQDSTLLLLESLADTVDLRDPYTGGHSRRVAEWSANILRELKIYGPEAELIRAAARLHDIGKIGVPDQILNKTDRLTLEEKRIKDSHPARGAELLARFPDFKRGVTIVRGHHERWDGQGYPDRLTGWDIPFGARVIAVADSFDAMTSDRPYRAGIPIPKAAHILQEGRGRQWDPAVVDAFLRYLEQTPAGAEDKISVPNLMEPTLGTTVPAL